jgi:dTDP-4-amino-4,6-dideoxygalactose transaminase
MAGEQTGAIRPGEPAAATRIRELLAERTSTKPGEWHLVFKARHGMRVVMDAIAADAPKAEVATQLFTCCTAVDPITAAGLTPVFGDISPETLSLDVATLPVSEKTAAVMLQHTCGLMSAADETLAQTAHAAGAIVLEDCAHCVGRMAVGADGRPLADVSFHSFGVEKMLPTHFGGAVWVSPAFARTELGTAVTERLLGLPELDERLAKAARSYLNQMRVLNHLPAGASKALRKKLTDRGALEPAVAAQERAGKVSGEPAKPSAWVCETALAALAGLGANEARRSVAVAAYADAFKGKGGVRVPAAAMATDAGPLLRFPVFVEGEAAADEAIQRVCAVGHYATAWYREPLYPGATDLAAYGLNGSWEAWPKTTAACEGAVSLPCDVTPEQAAAIAALF